MRAPRAREAERATGARNGFRVDTPPEARLAQNYRLVHAIVREHGPGTHLSPADVFAYAKARRPGIGFTTVYRALARLRDLGLIAEILLPGAESAYYEPAGKAHAHFRCDACGSVTDVDYALPPDVIADLGKRSGVEIGEVMLSLHGRCARCRDRGA